MTFTQWLGTRRLYQVDREHIDGSDLPLTTSPVWSLVHQNPDGSPSQSIGRLETSPDCTTARFTADMLGTVTVTIAAGTSTDTHVTSFMINVLPHPPVSAATPKVPGSKLNVQQVRNGPTH